MSGYICFDLVCDSAADAEFLTSFLSDKPLLLEVLVATYQYDPSACLVFIRHLLFVAKQPHL